MPGEDAPDLFSFQMLTLLLIGVNAVVVYRYVGSVATDDMGRLYRLLELFVPALLGTALVAYLDEVRDRVLRLSLSRWTTAGAALFLLVLSGPHLLDFRVPVRVEEGAEAVLGGPGDPVVLGPGTHALELADFRSHRVVVRDDLAGTPEEGGEAVQDEVTLGLRHLLRSEAAEWRLGRFLLGEREIVLAPVYPVTIETDAAGAELVAEGRFPELYLLKKARRKNGNLRFSPDSGRVRFPVRTVGLFDGVELPPGTYDLRLHEPQRRCARRLSRPYTVARGDTMIVRFGGLPCEPWHAR